MAEQNRHHLDNIAFFGGLSKKMLSFVSSFLEEQHFASGKIILRQGSHGGNLYLIKRGVISVQVTLPGDTTKEATKLYPGQMFGEVAFLAKNLITANIIAAEDCDCLILKRNVLDMLRVVHPKVAFQIEQAIAQQTVDKIISNIKRISEFLQFQIPEQALIQSAHAQRLVNPQAQRRVLSKEVINITYLSQLNYFCDLTTEQRKTVLEFLTVREYDRGYQFSALKDESLTISVIYAGAAMLFIKEGNQLKKSIAVAGVGELVAQHVFSPGFDDIAGEVTCEKSIILELDYEAYKELEQHHPAIFYAISQCIHKAIACSVYIINRQFIRINSEYKDLISEGRLCAGY